MTSRRISGQIITRDAYRSSCERRGGQGKGKAAERLFEAECRDLESRGRLVWWRIPDPLIPTGRTTQRGLLECAPREREGVTDYLVAAAERGHRITGVEVKSSSNKVSWSPRSSLRDGQRAALLKLHAEGLDALVYLVRELDDGTTARYLLDTVTHPQLLDEDASAIKWSSLAPIDAGDTWLDDLLKRRALI